MSDKFEKWKSLAILDSNIVYIWYMFITYIQSYRAGEILHRKNVHIYTHFVGKIPIETASGGIKLHFEI